MGTQLPPPQKKGAQQLPTFRSTAVARLPISATAELLLWSSYGIGQAIIFLPCGFFLSFFYLVSMAANWMSTNVPYFHTWCGLSTNLECKSETCCTQLPGNAGRKKSPKIRHMGTNAQLCRAISSPLRHISTIGKHLLKAISPPHVLTIW